MADPLISLDTEHAFVQPGGQVRVTVTITNTGNLVEGYWLQVLGPAAAWAEVVPPEISVYPQQDATAAVILSPPADGSALSGVLPFGVLASSTDVLGAATYGAEFASVVERDNVFGVQFHPEVRGEQVESWLAEDPDDVADPAALRAATRERIAAWNELGRRLCSAFLQAV